MKAHYHCKDLFEGRGNFGDNLTPYILNKLGFSCEYSPADDTPHVFLAGSILKFANSHTKVLGAGFGSKTQKVSGKPDLKIVRGHLTGQALIEQGFEKTWAYGDPGLVLPELFNPKIEKTHAVGVVPHYVDLGLKLPEGLIIEPFLPVETFISKMLSCETIISSSLHGLITAQAYGIPWTWAKFSDNVNSPEDFKFYDFFSSVKAHGKPVDFRLTQKHTPKKQGFNPMGLLTLIKRGLR